MKLKKALVLIFVFMVGFLAFNKEVFANDYIGSCEYDTAIPGTETDWKMDSNGLSLILFENNVNVYCGMTYGILGGGCKANAPSSLVVYDSSAKTYYCPTKMYLNMDTDIGRANFSLATNHRTDGKAYFTVSNVTPKLSSDAGPYKIKTYTPLEKEDNQTLKPCLSGGTDLLNAVNNGKIELRYTVKGSDNRDQSKKINTSIDELSKKNNVSGTSAAIEIAKINAMYNHITSNYYIKDGNTNYPKYCAFLVDGNDAKTQKKLRDLNEAIDHYQQIVNSSSDLTQAQKEEATQNAQNAKRTFTSIASTATITRYDPGPNVINCDSLIDENLKAVIQLVLKWVRIIAPILLIILMSVDFGQAVISQDQDAMKKATSKAVKRAIAAIALFFVPLLVSVMINWIDSSYFDKNASNCEEVLR